MKKDRIKEIIDMADLSMFEREILDSVHRLVTYFPEKFNEKEALWYVISHYRKADERFRAWNGHIFITISNETIIENLNRRMKKKWELIR